MKSLDDIIDELVALEVSYNQDLTNLEGMLHEATTENEELRGTIMVLEQDIFYLKSEIGELRHDLAKEQV
jgi:predicted RNase H-like nuclease (RuvC/YqgF family)